MTIIGIDPGKNGGIAWCHEIGDWTTTGVEKMPETDTDLLELLCSISGEGECKAFLERVHSMPGQGVASTFEFGRGFGALRMALLALGIPFDMVTPQTWQKSMSCLSKGDKNVTKSRAQELFPSLKVTHATADALLICEYGRRTHK